MNQHNIYLTLHDLPLVLLRPACLEELWQNMTACAAKPGSSTSAALKPNNQSAPNQKEIARAPHLPATPSLLQSFAEDDRIPYWAELWPSSIALATWLKEQTLLIKDKLCLDLGCGLGLSALAGANAGAKVIGLDYELEALRYAKLSAAHPLNLAYVNANSQAHPITWLTADWRSPCFKRHSLNFIWAGDIMYEKRFFEPVAAFIEHCLAKDGCFWLAEPGRNLYPQFQQMMQDRGWQTSLLERKSAGLPNSGAPKASVQIWQLTRGPFKFGPPPAQV